jgi:hypothetical protein
MDLGYVRTVLTHAAAVHTWGGHLARAGGPRPRGPEAPRPRRVRAGARPSPDPV